MTAAVVWLVLWVVFAFAGAWALIGAGTLGGVGLAAASEKFWVAPLSAIIGWLLGISWFVFAAIQVILQIVDVVRLVGVG